MKIIYSFNKKGFEADYWNREIKAASHNDIEFIPFNHDAYLDSNLYVRAQLLDNLYFDKHPGLMRLYEDISRKIVETKADALLVDNCPPYHPDFLYKLNIYKALRIADGPISAYDRDFAYLHAYDHILYHSPAYSRDFRMKEKLHYCGAKKADFWPLASFEAMCDPTKTENDILEHERDIEIAFIGTLHVNKMPLLAKIQKNFRNRLKFNGQTSLKKNIYFNLMYGFPGWIKPLPGDQFASVYQRTKIGINLHNRGDYTVGNYRLFDLPANGVMQLSDGGDYLKEYFKPGEEIVSYNGVDDLIEKINYYLKHDEERNRIALNGFKRVLKEYKISDVLKKACRLISQGMHSQNKKA